ncbi:MAG TPA: hypothetical protein DCP67_08655, partial [Planctomycetaceae bacterium]|nr:hypothetical protein [Planctomycetaceae bacterium]
MIIGLMILWTGCGTFAFGDIDGEAGLFSQVRPEENHYQLQTPDGLVAFAAQDELRKAVLDANVAGDEK